LRLGFSFFSKELSFMNYAGAPAVGLILGFAMVWWVRPDTNAAAVFIVVATIIGLLAAKFVLGFVRKLVGRSSELFDRAVKHDDIT
jgi:hypothetical protein